MFLVCFLNFSAEIFEYTLTSNFPKFIVIASDGVWEFLTNEKVAEIVNWYYKNNDVNGAADKLVEEAIKKWKIVSFYRKINFFHFYYNFFIVITLHF